MHESTTYITGVYANVAGLTFRILAENLSIRFNSPSRIHDIFLKGYLKDLNISRYYGNDHYSSPQPCSVA